MSNVKNPLRLQKKHGGGKRLDVTSADGHRLVQAQSLRNALVVSCVVIILFSLFWIALSALTNRVFPWLTVVLGFLLGHGVRLAGRGVDWRFPACAALLAFLGALLANVAVGASVSADELGIGTLEVLRSVTAMTWPVFFDEKMTTADIFFAAVAAAIAAFFANRHLTRAQYHSLRLWKEEQANV